ncbi:hypothetical protein PENFLA_c037G07516 [Penicillium flavigenum]|uniref:Uncharacterized protein n=1 Tax=Penicillium flavigenum TaxID=254877 RepID=A0A1V6SKC9_9EURO|nr:hypothetical protein PENFLA_c037G07516 [Penicillium flavigenum]
MSATQALSLEPNTLYILLLDLGGNCLFEWKLYLTSTPTTGQTFHITNETGPTSWQYKSEVVYNIASNTRVVLALKIGAVGPVLHAARRAGSTSCTRPVGAVLGSIPRGPLLPRVGPGGAFCIG